MIMAEEKKFLPEEEQATEEKSEVAEAAEAADEKEETTPDASDNKEANPEVADNEEKTKPKKKGLVIGICAVLVAVVVGVVAVMSGFGVKKEPGTETQAPETEVTEAYDTIPAVSVEQSQLDKVVYSSQVGEVDGKLYAVVGVGTEKYEGYYRQATEKPVIPELPVETEGYITSFAQYGDYVYYVVTEDDKQQSTYTLYRCKTDFTESEQLFLQSSYTMEGSVGIYGTFVIDNGKLFSTPEYIGDKEPRQYKCVDLTTKEVTDITPEDYNKAFGAEGEQKVDIYGGKVFLSQSGWNKDGKTFAYMIDGNKKIPLTDESITDEFCGKSIVGCAGDCVYYTEIFNAPVDGANGKLKSYNLTTGEIKTLDQRLIGGDSNYFKVYEEIVEG